MKAFARLIALAAALMLLIAMPRAFAEEIDGDCVYTLVDESGRALTRRGGKMYVGDEYISGDDRYYRIISVDDVSQTATAEDLGEATIDVSALSSFLKAYAKTETDGEKLVCMYSTHSDESYVPTDGDSSLWENAGIYDVGDALKKELESRGIKTVYSKETFLPHDAGAYNRSRATAEELLKKGPDALLDIHRDATPADEYETEVEGEDISKVRLFVGRSNQNRAANKAFAQQIKKTADKEYPGLIKDIYIGKGNYNQELYPHALLLEFGTHKIEKDKAIGATGYMADVLSQVLYGETAKAEETASPAIKGIAWAVGIAIVGALIYALVSTGTFDGMKKKLARGVSEITGGAIGKKPNNR